MKLWNVQPRRGKADVKNNCTFSWNTIGLIWLQSSCTCSKNVQPFRWHARYSCFNIINPSLGYYRVCKYYLTPSKPFTYEPDPNFLNLNLKWMSKIKNFSNGARAPPWRAERTRSSPLRALHPGGPYLWARVWQTWFPMLVLYLSYRPMDKHPCFVCLGFGCVWQASFAKMERQTGTLNLKKGAVAKWWLPG